LKHFGRWKRNVEKKSNSLRGREQKEKKERKKPLSKKTTTTKEEKEKKRPHVWVSLLQNAWKNHEVIVMNPDQIARLPLGFDDVSKGLIGLHVRVPQLLVKPFLCKQVVEERPENAVGETIVVLIGDSLVQIYWDTGFLAKCFRKGFSLSLQTKTLAPVRNRGCFVPFLLEEGVGKKEEKEEREKKKKKKGTFSRA
jgi:hypothetical protein